MIKLVNQTIFRKKIREKDIPIFSSIQVMAIFGLSKDAAAAILHRYTKEGFIVRLKRGLYAFPDALPPVGYIANMLYQPSYISLDFALSYHGMLPETVYAITSLTTKATRRFECQGIVYSFRRIQKGAFTGYETRRQSGVSFFIADPEKAYVDTQYFRLIDGLEPLSRFRKEKLQKTQALSYAALYRNGALAEIIEKTL